MEYEVEFVELENNNNSWVHQKNSENTKERDRKS